MPTPPARTVDQDRAPGARLRRLEALQRGGTRQRDGSRRLEAEAGRQGRELVGRATACSANVPRPSPKTRSPGCHCEAFVADRLDDAGEVGAADEDARTPQAEDGRRHEPGDAWLAAHDVPVAGVDRGRPRRGPEPPRAQVPASPRTARRGRLAIRTGAARRRGSSPCRTPGYAAREAMLRRDGSWSSLHLRAQHGPHGDRERDDEPREGRDSQVRPLVACQATLQQRVLGDLASTHGRRSRNHSWLIASNASSPAARTRRPCRPRLRRRCCG